jgi:hypothetical protein
MASEIAVAFDVLLTKNLIRAGFSMPTGTRYNQAGTGVDANLWTVATILTDLVPTGIVTKGYIALKNTDPTNPVSVGYNDAGTLRDLATLDAGGGMAFFKIKTGRTLAGIATGSSVVVQYFLMEN